MVEGNPPTLRVLGPSYSLNNKYYLKWKCVTYIIIQHFTLLTLLDSKVLIKYLIWVLKDLIGMKQPEFDMGHIIG